jgi:GNAT superfamily N-acetyltransferase
VIEYRHLDSAGALEHVADLQAVYGAVFGEPPYNEGPEMVRRFAGWLRDEVKESGFDLVEARDCEQLVGFAYGNTAADGWWWGHADAPPPDEVRAGRLFVVQEWAVLPEERGHGVGRRLMDELLKERDESWATLMVNVEAPARDVYLRWGWRRVAGTKPGAGPSMDVLVRRPGARQ